MADLAAETLQENLLTLLIYDEENGATVAREVPVSCFSGDYRTIAERCVEYRRKYHKAPSKAHIYDLMADILGDTNNGKRGVIYQALDAMQRLAETINVEFVLDRMHLFVRNGAISHAILKSAQLVEQKREDAIPEIEDLWANVLRDDCHRSDRQGNYVVGRVSLFDHSSGDGFSFGITGLENLRLERGKLTTIAGATGIGKSWMLTHIGAFNVLPGSTRVLHISLEMSERACELRLAQMVTGRTKEQLRYQETKLLGEDAKFRDWDAINEHTGRYRFRYIIRKLKARVATVKDIASEIQAFESDKGRAPDIVSVDHIGLVKCSGKDTRHIDIAENITALRELAIEFNAAFVVAAQINREGAKKQMATEKDIGESFGIIQDSDQVLVLSRPASSSKERIIWVGKVRDGTDGFRVRIQTDFEHGQLDRDFGEDDSADGERLNAKVNELRARMEEADLPWNLDIRGKNPLPTLIADVYSISNDEAKEVLERLIGDGVLEVYEANTNSGNKRKFVRFAKADEGKITDEPTDE